MKALDIAFVPYLNASRWSRDFNRLMSGVFPTPYLPGLTKDPYVKTRLSALRNQLPTIEWIRKRSSKGVFYANLNRDFMPESVYLTDAEKFWGFVHVPSVPLMGPNEARLAPYDRGIYELCDGVYVASELTRTRSTPRARVIGLPLFGEAGTPNDGDKILFNHRLVPEKRWKALSKLPKKMRERLTISCPRATSRELDEAGKLAAVVHLDPPEVQYLSLLNRHAYTLSYARADHFGYAVLEAVWNGSFVLAPGSTDLPYHEFLPPEMLYDDEQEVPIRIREMDERVSERKELVRSAQGRLAHLRSDRWIERLLAEVGVA